MDFTIIPFLRQDEIHNTLFTNDLKFKYVSKWERAREEQNAARLCQSEKKLECQLTDLKDNINMELKCHVATETYIRQTIAVSNYIRG
jgi:hypothetical protein